MSSTANREGHWAVKLIRIDPDLDSQTVWVEYYTDENQARDRAKSVTDYSNINYIFVGEISWTSRAKKQHSTENS